MSTISNPTPKRGGMHPIYGAFVGGGPMDLTYNLINPDFHCVSQLRTIKQLQNIQNSFEQARDNVAGVKFHGNLEVDEVKATTELDKKNFVERVELIVNTYGFQSFFYMQAADGKMYSLLTHSHLFTLSSVLQEHRERLSPHVPVYDSSGTETPESVLINYKKYDAYEKLDGNLSRLGVQSVIGKVLQDDIKTRYSHLPDFLTLPGSVYFMMALEASNASVALDIDEALEKFNNLTLASYPGENIKSFATEALRLIKIMEGGYCLPLKLGSDLMKKVYSTSCEHFNRWMHAKLDEVRELEMSYKLKDPKLMLDDPRYSTLGPIALCGFLQEKYGSLITEKAWPALSAALPVSNLAPISTDTDKDGRRRCYHCQSTDHLRDTCPKLGRDVPGEGSTGSSGGRSRRRGTNARGVAPGTGSGTPSPPPNPSNRSPFPAWRYIEPVDKNSTVVIGDISYKWCSKCRCRATGKQGYFTTHHFTHEHVDKQVSFDGGTSRDVSANHSSVAPLIPLADDLVQTDDIPDDEMLVFAGPWHSPVDSLEDQVIMCTELDSDSLEAHGSSVWMASISTVEEEGLQSDENVHGLQSDENVHDSIIPSAAILNAEVASSSLSTDQGLPVATAIPSTPLTSSSLRMFDASYARVYRTDPPLSIVDLDFAEYYPCDTAGCNLVGPGGFNCLSCPVGIFNTALVVCHHCLVGSGHLGEICELCQQTLWGRHLLPDGLPNQQLEDYVEEDPSCLLHIPRNNSRQHYVHDEGYYVPYPSANWIEAKNSVMEQSTSINKVSMKSPKAIRLLHDEDDDESDVFFDPDELSLGIDTDFMQENVPDDPVYPLSGNLGMFWLLYSCGMVIRWVVQSLWNRCLSGIVCGLKALQMKSCFICFILGTLFWDAVEALWKLSSVQERRSRRYRRRKQAQARFYPRHWVLLSSYMLTGGYRFLSPFLTTYFPIASTISRCCYISQHVHMSPWVVWDLHSSRMSQFFDGIVSHNVDGSIPRLFDDVKNSETSINCEPEKGEPDDIFYDAVAEVSSFDFLQFEDTSLFLPENFIDCTVKDDRFLQPSKPGLNAALTGVNFLDCLNPSRLNRFPVIFDSGASIAISGNKGDFIGKLQPPARELRLGGMARGAKVEGIGTVHWRFQTQTCSLTLALTCYYVPDCHARLLSPQRLFNSKRGVMGSFSIQEEHAILQLNDNPPLTIEYDTNNNLPVGLGTNADQSVSLLQANLCVTDDDNQNLTPAQKLLMMWHFRFGHRNLAFVQHLLRLPVFNGEKYRAASRAPLPKCAICEYAKAHAKSTSGNHQSVNPATDGAVKDGALRPGARVSADHFESRLKGRTYTSYGRTTSDQFVGGCIFVDHMSGYVHVEHQMGFSSSETIRAKQNFEQLALGNGILIEEYLTDNGVFSKTQFLEHIRNHNQQIHFCGVNAHHKNAVAERAIRTVSELARSLLLHASVHWPNGVDGSLWPMAVDYATHLYNTLPAHNGVCPSDLFSGTTIPRHKLRDLHVWGCPVYVLDPTLQQGMKLPRWQPRSRRGLFVGYSRHHSSDVPLILNLQTGSISPQFHVVFDDGFSTVKSIGADDSPPDFWTAPNLEACIHRVPVDPGDPSVSLLPDDWLTPHELEEKRRRVHRQAQIRETFVPSAIPSPASVPVPSVSSPSSSLPSPSSSEALATASIPTATTVDVPLQDSVPESSGSSLGGAPPIDLSSPSASSPPAQVSAVVPLRRSARTTKGSFHSTKYIDEVYLSSILEVPRSQHETEMAYHAELHTDLETGEVNFFDAHAYVAQVKKHDPDNPSYNEAMSGDDAHHYIEAMKQEIYALLQQRTWTRIDRSAVPKNPDGSDKKILKGTWAFKLKRLPDGTPLKYKARYCCRGDMQTAGIDYFDTYAPVVQWSTIRLILTLVLKHGWSTRQVDYTNAFAQAHLQEEVYIEPPRGFAGKDGTDKVLKLLKSLYGLKQAPKTFFEKLRAGLLERGFTQSNIDPCLFMKNEMMCVVYVDDTILCGPDSEALEAEIKGLGVNNLEQRHAFQLRNEGEVGDFLGIRIEKRENGKFYLTQTGLIEKILTITDMTDCNSLSTPTGKAAVGSDLEGDPFREKWKYATVIGMLLYLSGNTRPDITFAVHQCARYSHNPKHSHAVAVKRIIRYLKGTKDKGMIFSPVGNLEVNCYVDADFAGLWGVEYDQDTVSVKSRTGYLIMFMNCPLLWVSKLQTQIALSTMEAEYIALSSAMRELIAIRAILKEIKESVFKSLSKPSYSMIAKTFEPLPPSQVYEDNESCLKFATLPRMSPRTKHIAIPYHFFRSKVSELEIQVLPIDTTEQLADQFTKGLREEDFVKGRKRIMGW